LSGESHEGRDEKLAASEIFKTVWRQCTSDSDYLGLKEAFLKEQKEWDRREKNIKKEQPSADIKEGCSD
jgi:hypothetical protein